MSVAESEEDLRSGSVCQHNANSSRDLTTPTAGKSEFRTLMEVRFVLDSRHQNALRSHGNEPPELKDIRDRYYCNIFMEDWTLVVNWTTRTPPPKSIIEKVTASVQAFIRKAVDDDQLSKFSAAVLFPKIRNQQYQLLLDECKNSKFDRCDNGWQLVEISGTREEVDASLQHIRGIVTQYAEEKLIVGEDQYKFLRVALQCDCFRRNLCDAVDVEMKACPFICLNGPKDDVKTVAKRIAEAVSKLVNSSVPCSTHVLNWLSKDRILANFQQLLIQRNIAAAVQVKDGTFCALFDSSSTVESAEAILKDAVMWQPVAVKFDDLHDLVRSDCLKAELSRILGNNAELVDEKQNWYLICWLDDANEIMKNLGDFVLKNKIEKRKVKCSEAQIAYIYQYLEADFKAIAEWTDQSTLMKLEIVPDSDGFLLAGNSKLVDRGQEKLTELIQKVENHLFRVDVVPKAHELLKGRISEIEKQTGTIIRLLDPDLIDSSTGYPSPSERAEGPFSTNEHLESPGGKANAPEDIVILPVWSELCDVKADVLVNSINWELDLNKGLISRSLNERAGSTLQKELNRRYPQGLELFQYAVTKSHNIGCRALIHVACAPYCGKYTEDMLLSLFVDCLKVAEKKRAASIAFPAIGTGNLKYPPATVFRLLHDAVAIFRKDRKTTSLRKVYCSLMDQRHREPFEECNKEQVNRGKSGVGVERKSSFQAKPPGSPALGITIKKSTVQIMENIPSRKSHIVIRFDRTKKKPNDTGHSGINPGYVHIDKDVDLSKLQAALEAAIRISESFKAKSISVVAHKNDKKTARCLTEVLCNYGSQDGCAITDISLIVSPDQLSTYCQTLLTTCFQPEYPLDKTSWFDRLNLRPLFEQTFSYFIKQSPKIYDTSDGTLVIAIFGTSHTQMKQAEVQLSGLLNQECVNEIITCNPEDVSILDDKQINALHELGSSHNTRISVHVDQGRVFIQGFSKEEVDRAREKVKDFLAHASREWYQSEIKRQALERATALQESVQWQYQDDSGTWQNFEAITSMQIEVSSEKATACSLKETSIGDFDYNPVTSPNSVSVAGRSRRKTYEIRKIDVLAWRKFPKEWTYSETYLECPVPKDTEEYVAIESEFLNNAGASANEVLEITRIQDPHAWRMLKIIEEKARSSTVAKFEPCTRRLWHGTSAETVSAILHDKFNRSFVFEEVLYGKGVYFARDASYAAQPQYARARDGSSTIILAEVVTGCFTKGAPSMKVPPKRLDKTNLAFDSTVDDENDPSIFVIYHDAQAYPLYVIRFK